ncbi:hypothetical protein F0L68_41190 [Solihabitans fulvus]|uniref:Uncharacterized protein n=1 Tax=Solihabitans fulvus TaxID=1892852 RepID=A0A5B2W424_9PSEU|nr:hypothetical protein [Solihabitans fulvus]KAA2245884.1 hypothetical protein F0L68_41190 [Solihabitans fulvus]
MSTVVSTVIACDWPGCAERLVLPSDRRPLGGKAREAGWFVVDGVVPMQFCPGEPGVRAGHVPFVAAGSARGELFVACLCGWSMQKCLHRRAEHEPAVRSRRDAYRLWQEHAQSVVS